MSAVLARPVGVPSSGRRRFPGCVGDERGGERWYDLGRTFGLTDES